MAAAGGAVAGDGQGSASVCLVIHPSLGKARRHADRDPVVRLAEAVALARAIRLPVVHAEVVNLARPHPSTLFGTGTVDRLKAIVAEHVDMAGGRATVAFIDSALSPVQQRNLERAWGCKVVDRTGLILEIFGERARTAEGELQVELAALTYQKSRLVRSWTHLERQRGGFGFMGGPGEAQIETDRRLIRDRIARLRRDLEQVRRTRALHRRARKRVPYPVIALVGYTNAGKSTLFNALAGATVFTADQVFATLDPTMRQIRLPSGRTAILSDTVGFISDLPHELVEAFRATLEEVTEADLILHVRDISIADTDEQRDDVLAVLVDLARLGAAAATGDGRDHDGDGGRRPSDAPGGGGGGTGEDRGGAAARSDRPVIEALNKVDLVGDDDRATLRNRAERSNGLQVVISARTGEGLDRLLAILDGRLADDFQVVEVDLAPAEGARLAWLYAHGEVLARHDSDAGIHLTVRLSPVAAARFRRAP